MNAQMCVLLCSPFGAGLNCVSYYRAQYGAPGDFDDWAQIIEDDSWSWKNLQRSVFIFFFTL